MRELAIVQPYVPQYRVPFFEGLSHALQADGVTLRVIAGTPTGAQQARADAAQADWLETVTPRGLDIGSRHLSLTYSRSLWRNADAVIVPHQGTSLDAVSALAYRGSRRVGVWGHIAPYTSPLNVIDGAIERWQLRRAHHVFAYMPGGANFARRAGVESSRITTIMNSIDSADLESELTHQSAASARESLRARGVPDGRYLAYVGGLDESKRIAFLARALDVLHDRNSNVHLVVLGSGEQSGTLGPAAARGQVTLLGYGGTADKASVLLGAEAVVNPGRIGLIAVDCLASRTPLITTEWPWHAPEVEYLTRGVHMHVAANDVDAFADAMDRGASGALAPADEAWPAPPTIQAMVQNFRSGVRRLLR